MTISLEAALKTWRVDPGLADVAYSDRYIGSGENKLCPVWDGRDMVGREVSPDTFYTKTGGCNGADDRILVENQIERPRYYEYIQYNTEGLQGDPQPDQRRYYGWDNVSSALKADTMGPSMRQETAESIYLKSLM
jgi:hypothetical protein